MVVLSCLLHFPVVFPTPERTGTFLVMALLCRVNNDSFLSSSSFSRLPSTSCENISSSYNAAIDDKKIKVYVAPKKLKTNKKRAPISFCDTQSSLPQYLSAYYYTFYIPASYT